MFENEACHVLFVTFVAWNFTTILFIIFSVYEETECRPVRAPGQRVEQ